MPNLKHIKVRIKSIKSTQKITQAMKLVAASKVRRAQVRVLSSRPYTQQIVNFMDKVVASISSLDKKDIPFMQEKEVKSAGIIVITSDRGLCGSYNTNILKKASRRVIELEKSGVKPKLIVIGNKANNFFRRTKVEILESFTQLPAVPNIELANLIAGSAENVFLNKTIDAVEIIGTDFISMLRNEVYTKQFLPVAPAKSSPISGQDESSPYTSSPEVLFEPSLDAVLGRLLPLYLSNIIYHALLEASCSELASRMNAMSSATKNAKELIEKLTIVYNKARQAAITQELSEIVGGVGAIK